MTESLDPLEAELSALQPLEMSPETISSAIRPAMVVAIRSSISLRRRLSTSVLGNDIVEPSAWPRGMIVTLCSG